MKEFDLIEHYFSNKGLNRKDVAVGVGDDAAVITVPENYNLLVTTDTLVEGVHFFPDISPAALGHRVIAVNLSDLAAMGAEPCWVSVAITLPEINEQWIDAFSSGLFETCDYYNVQVIGGDTTQGPLSVTITAQGIVPEGKAILRSGAKPGDFIYVTGSLGDAGLAVAARKHDLNISEQNRSFLNERLEYPSPRVGLGQAIRGTASAAIDVSDGLISDLRHILKASGVGAAIDVDKLPLSRALKQSVDEEQQINYALSAGDDYELLFTVPPDKRGALDVMVGQYGMEITCIGQVQGVEPKIDFRKNGESIELSLTGYQHFSTAAQDNE